MKKVLLGTLAVVLLASPFAILRAEDATTSTSSKPFRKEERKEWREEWKGAVMLGQERMGNLQEKMGARRDEMRLRFDQKRADVITNILNRLEERFQNAINRMESFTTRIQERINLLEDEGGSFDEAQGHLNTAKETLDDAQDALEDIDLDALVATTSSTTRQSIRAEFNVVKELLKSAHAKLADAISSIKKGLSTDSDDDN